MRLEESTAESAAPVPEGALTIEVVVPGTVSGLDETDAPNVSLAAPAPDHVLGNFGYNDAGSNGSVQSGLETSARAATGASDSSQHSPGLSLLDNPLSALKLDSTTSAPVIASSSDDDLVYEPIEGPPSWAWVLLASYASALTLAFAWMFYTGRVRLRPEPVRITASTDSRPDLGQRDEQSQLVLPLPPIPRDKITTLGQPLRLGDLELVPLGVRADQVTLRRLPLDSRPETRNGGENALFLKILLRNLSRTALFAPLDQEFVRERDHGFPDSCIVTGGDDRITIYPLARESEWTIAGQKFAELRPGGALETVVVSQPDALGRTTKDMTWRLKLRTGVAATEVVGVRFSDQDISKDGG
jgi:hypothetical protein